MNNFAAIDFETANGRRSSVCSVGIVIVRDGEIVDKFYSLIHPTPNYYTYWTTQIHGLTRKDTDRQPIFRMSGHRSLLVSKDCLLWRTTDHLTRGV